MNTNPVRLRRLRRKGFDLQAASRAINGRECVIVDRTNRRWGNPFVVGKHGTPDECLHGYREYLEAAQAANPEEFANELAKLRGKNLACWCAPEQQCHVDVLLEWANKEERMELR